MLDIAKPGGSLEVLVVPTPVHCPHAVPKEEGQTLRQGMAEPVLPHLRSVPKFLPSAHPPGPGSCAGAAALLWVREVPGAGCCPPGLGTWGPLLPRRLEASRVSGCPNCRMRPSWKPWEPWGRLICAPNVPPLLVFVYNWDGEAQGWRRAVPGSGERVTRLVGLVGSL